MERQYSVEFFTTFVENLQQLCQNYLNFTQFVEVSGYISVEIDNVKKERYVLSELLQSSGNVVSESFCVKAFETMHSARSSVNMSDRRGARKEREKKPMMGRYRTQEASSVSYSAEMEQATKTESRNEMASFPGYQSDVFIPNAGPSSSNFFQETTNVPHERVSLPHEHMRLPQKRPRGSSQSTVSRSSDCPAFPNDSVIDLDLIDDDDLDLPMDESGQEDASFHVHGPQQPAVSIFPSQRKPGLAVLSPASLSTTKYTVKQFTRFHFNRSGRKVNLLTLPPETLDTMLTLFYYEAKKVTGGDLKPRSLQNVQACLNRYLKDGGYPYSILKDEEFQGSREVLKKRLAEILVKSVPMHFDVKEADSHMLFQKGLLGGSSGEVLINTMWFINTKCFKKKAPTEHFNMKWGDIILKVADNGLESLVYQVDGAYRTVYAEPQCPDQCLVEFYKQYMKRRPKIAMDDGYAFYLKVNSDARDTEVFLPEPLTVEELESVWRKLIVASRLPPNKMIS